MGLKSGERCPYKRGDRELSTEVTRVTQPPAAIQKLRERQGRGSTSEPRRVGAGRGERRGEEGEESGGRVGEARAAGANPKGTLIWDFWPLEL